MAAVDATRYSERWPGGDACCNCLHPVTCVACPFQLRTHNIKVQLSYCWNRLAIQRRPRYSLFPSSSNLHSNRGIGSVLQPDSQISNHYSATHILQYFAAQQIRAIHIRLLLYLSPQGSFTAPIESDCCRPRNRNLRIQSPHSARNRQSVSNRLQTG